jgi:hypothetical protein
MTGHSGHPFDAASGGEIPSAQRAERGTKRNTRRTSRAPTNVQSRWTLAVASASV